MSYPPALTVILPHEPDRSPGEIRLSSSIPATADGKAKSLCAFSGLNDFDADEGQTTKQTQTPADGAPGDPGLG
ncbi:MAG TPA: hypothetical protein VFU51_15260, partial [Gaiellaceae bacterium]|nr:hypothetical protein [Gaiellaceae bacterium]